MTDFENNQEKTQGAEDAYTKQQAERVDSLNQSFQAYQQAHGGNEQPSAAPQAPQGYVPGGFSTGGIAPEQGASQAPNQPPYTQPTSPNGQNYYQNNQNYYQPGSYQNYGQPQGDKAHTYALISMICGIASCVLFWSSVSSILGLGAGIAAIILALQSGKLSPDGKRESMATAGLITGIVGIALCVMGFACALCLCASAASFMDSFQYFR